MARHSIIEKLERELRGPIASERQIVYLLVEIRKLIELNQGGANYRSLKFSCDWVAHPVLKGPEAQNVVRQFDQYQEMIEEMHSATHGQRLTVSMDFMSGLSEILRLSKFRRELGEYLRRQGLDSSISDDDQKWTGFLAHYVKVIEDCPLKCIGQNLKYADEVVLRVVDVKKRESTANARDYQLVIEWSWISKITRIVSVSQQFY